MNPRCSVGRCVLIAALVSNSSVRAKSVTATDAPIMLAPIEVHSLRLHRAVLATPAAIDVTDGAVVRQGRRKVQLDDALNRTPGVYANNASNFAQNLRVSIRGFGARSAFGVRGVRVRVDGIPETLPDGQAQTDSIDLGAIERLEVLRGPFSALYGNATGGVIDITTTTPASGPFDRGQIAAGGNGYRRASVSSARRRDGWGYALTASRLDIDGYREHSAMQKKQLTGKIVHDAGDTGELRLITRILDAPDTLDPGGITLAQAQADRRAARDRNKALDSRQSATQQTFGLIYDDQLTDSQSYRGNLFYTHRDFIQHLPFEEAGVVAYERDFFGGGLQTTRFDDWFGHENQLTAGIDVQVQQDARGRFGNAAGSKGPRTLSEDQQATSVGLFVQNVFSITPDLELTTGLRHDWLDFDIDDHFIDAENPDDSGSRTYRELSANIGVSYAWASNQRVYANVANAFESPTFTEFADPSGNGGFNSALEPQKATQYEIGAKGGIAGRAHYRIGAFWIDVRDELVVFNDDGRRDFYENSGESSRRGFETRMAYDFSDRLSATASYTRAEYEFRAFADRQGNDYAGNRLPGLPEQTFFGELAWRDPKVGYAVLDAHWTGPLYADNANTRRVDGYWVLNGRVGKTIAGGDDAITAYLGVDNILNEAYFDNIRINAFGGRYYEPAPDRTVFAGIVYAL